LGALANVFDPRASEWEVGVELGDLIDPALDFTGESNGALRRRFYGFPGIFKPKQPDPGVDGSQAAMVL
jgi:hypothetical protein